ncbi:hypothetical protein jhhlp_007308 [Lomentospora prolificans]|uniref:3-phytase n=1 Tax=Lomentospora prolificans TaxID=41688 RepID=A0A2N3N2A7_9PEZI|nr:hypothetical protein jhhlp_007308 [Lomentospora prolificans]
MAPSLDPAYELVNQHDTHQEPEPDNTSRKPRHSPGLRSRTTKAVVVVLAACFIVFAVFEIISNDAVDRFRKAMSNASGGGANCQCQPSDVPQYFQTKPQLWPGPTITGQPAFMAQTVALDPSQTYVPNEPLMTAIPIQGMTPQNQSIFQMMGYLSPYFPSPGFGIDEHPLPPGAEIIQLHMLSRHGARYPTLGSQVESFGQRLAAAAGTFKASGRLEFLNDWKYELGAEILVPKGRQELYDSGVLHAYMYSRLYDPNTKIIARTTTQDRMLKSAENFMAGFFGLDWTNNVTLEVIIEADNFNNSLAGYLACPNSGMNSAPFEASATWKNIYLEDATERFKSLVEGYEWTVDDTFAIQMLCPYETVAYGYSVFCDLFTYEEWEGFGYTIDIEFAGSSGFQSPTGRAVGIGYQQEFIARLKNQTLDYVGSQINVTLDNNTDTFPLDQSLYFDFSHDSNIVSVLTAFGLKQFAPFLNPTRHPGPHNFTVSHVTPFGARLDMEIIRTPKPVSSDRSGYLSGGETKYVHFILNQRTLPLGASFSECDASRVDGWCELETFIRVQEKMPEIARYDYACYSDLPKYKYGDVSDGVPPSLLSD